MTPHSGKFDLAAHLASVHGNAVELHGQHINPSYARMLRSLSACVQTLHLESAALLVPMRGSKPHALGRRLLLGC